MKFMQQTNRTNEAKKILNNILIVKDTNETVLERWVSVRKMVSELRKGFAFSPIIVTPAELETRLGKGDHFFEEIIRRGKNLYAR